MTVTETRPVAVQPITDGDVDAVVRFVRAEMRSRASAEAWRALINPPWEVEQPNHGFMLVAGDEVVGVYLAIYSERRIGDAVEKFCNLAVWCVTPEHRAEGLRLMRALLRQRGYTFVDLSPSGNVIALNERLGFKRLDTRTALIPNFPWPWRARGVELFTDPTQLERHLEGDALRIYRDHSPTAARQLVVRVGGRSSLVIYRRDRLKRLPAFASIVHVTDPDVFRAAARHIFRHLLFRHGMIATMAELRVVGSRPRPSILIDAPRPKMYRGSLDPEHIDYLYSELTCLAW